MLCKKCGADNPQGTQFCGQCGVSLPAENETNGFNPYLPPNSPMIQPNIAKVEGDYQVFAIVLIVVSTLATCCYCAGLPSLVLSIIALIMNNNARTKLYLSDTLGAERDVKTAKILCWIAAGLLIAVVLLIIVGVVLAIIFGDSHRW